MNELLSATPEATWEHIAPELDTALGELSEADRDVLLLQYFERKSALKAYAAANNGSQPADATQIIPYLTTPEQQAAWQTLQKRYPAKGTPP